MSAYESGRYWSVISDFHDDHGQPKAERVHDLIRGLPINSILDIGCGSGRALMTLCNMTRAKGYGIDLSPEPIAFANQYYANDQVGYAVADLGAVSGTTYDLVMLLDVFEHVDDYLGFLRSVRPLGRYFAFSIPLDMNVTSILFGGYMRARKMVGHLHYFTKESALATLEYAGFKVIGYRYADPGIQYGSAGGLLASCLRVAARQLSHDVETRLFGGNGIFVLAERTS
ncbi:class I SAM-dependent methyltransferase [Mesorhizobium delmotii]|uniref:Putative Methyltransferase type 11 n=1 Tax=Mesorhizobium delmotii TaxID=1631247 RepID=A0A2P9AF29_9HYPH|nr:class I SAM-dependent methyltransferase [Mesorhizobium delmotii]SJM29741.1 putative Methyltransferase type 11 [Mesorhizobium delmotii]